MLSFQTLDPSVGSNPYNRECWPGLLWQISEVCDPTWGLLTVSVTMSSDWGPEAFGLCGDLQ